MGASVMGISGLGLTSSLSPSLGNTTPISFGPSPLPHSQAMRFVQAADPIPGHLIGHMTQAGSPGEAFLGL